MTFCLPKKTLRLWQARAILITLLPVAALLGFGGLSPLFLIIAAGIAVAGLVITIIYLPLFYRSYKITVGDSAIEIENGVIIKVDRIMPYPRLIYVSSYASPLGRLMGLEGVTLKAARSRIILPELCREDTEEILKLGIRNM